ncbi:hypothetical protein J6TS2_52120 [Heyndrickxia sporothermodurans]|nr:hypothetical protein J6TS2_52120 [Heyndrickxia sporothermodurans]
MTTLLQDIEKLRNKLVEYGLKYGLNDASTIKLSQELDRLLNLELEERDMPLYEYFFVKD